MKCLRCNNEINENSKFCEYCGNKVETSVNMTNNQVNNIPNQNNTINTDVNNFENESMNNINGSVINSNANSDNIQGQSNANISNNIDFKTLEGATNLFRSLNFIGNNNCIFIAYNANYEPNPNSALRLSGLSVGSSVGGLSGGIVGVATGGMLSNSINAAHEEYVKKIDNPAIKLLMNKSDFCGYIVNITEFGFGFIPLMNNYSNITRIKNVEVHPEFFVSIKNEDVFNISLKKVKLPFMCTRIFMKIVFNSGDLNPKPKMSLRIHTKLDNINYQTNNSNNLYNIYKK